MALDGLPRLSRLREFFHFQMQDVPGLRRDAERVRDPVSHHPEDLFPRTDQRPFCARPPGDFEIDKEILLFDRLPTHPKWREAIPGTAGADDQAVSRQPLGIQPDGPGVSAFRPAFGVHGGFFFCQYPTSPQIKLGTTDRAWLPDLRPLRKG